MPSKKQSGDSFEIYIESIYQGLGFKTRRNQYIHGQQIDIVATKLVKGAGEVNLLIECKFLSKGNVSNQVVMDFQSYLRSLTNYPFTKGVIVTNTGYTTSAKLNANDNLVLTTLADLENQFFEVKASYSTLCSEYENEMIFTEYIPLAGKLIDEREENIEHYLFETINNYAAIKTPTFYSILGDYGSGKTTLQRRLLYRFGKNYLENFSLIKPFYLELKEYNKFKNLESFITATYQKQFRKEISFKSFHKELQNGGFLLLLDGFDEMSPQVNKQKRLEDFSILSRLIFSNSHAILTCRPSYFVSESEYIQFLSTYSTRQLVDETAHVLSIRARQQSLNETFKKLTSIYVNKTDDPVIVKKQAITINLCELNETQITIYLRKFQDKFVSVCHSNSDEIEAFLREIYDLSELMTKPLLLSMIKDTMLGHGVNFRAYRTEYGPAFLYEVYTELNLEVDWSKGKIRQFLSKDERREFASAIALSMFETSSLDVKYEVIFELINSYKERLGAIEKKISTSDAEAIATDIQICTFMTRTDEGRFKFIHTSFMEFFVAKYFTEYLEIGLVDERFRISILKSEILLFIGSYCLNKPNLKTQITTLLKESVDEKERRNLGIAYIYSAPEHNKFSLSNLKIFDANFKKITFSVSKFFEVEFSKVLIRDFTFKNSEFVGVTFSESNLDEINISECFGNISFDNTICSNIKVFNTTTANQFSINTFSTVLEKAEIINTNIKLEYADLQIIDSVISGGQVRFDNGNIEAGNKGVLSFANVVARNTSLSGEAFGCTGDIELISCLIEDMKFLGTKAGLTMKLFEGKVTASLIKNGHICALGEVVLFKNVEFEDCIFEIGQCEKIKFDSCQFKKTYFKGGSDNFSYNFYDCSFANSIINLLKVSDIVDLKLDEMTRGIIILNSKEKLSEIKNVVQNGNFYNISKNLFFVVEGEFQTNDKSFKNKVESLRLGNFGKYV